MRKRAERVFFGGIFLSAALVFFVSCSAIGYKIKNSHFARTSNSKPIGYWRADNGASFYEFHLRDDASLAFLECADSNGTKTRLQHEGSYSFEGQTVYYAYDKVSGELQWDKENDALTPSSGADFHLIIGAADFSNCP